MDKSEKASRLRAMLLQVTEGKSLETVARPRPAPAPTEGIEGAFSVEDDVKTSLERLQDGKEEDLSSADLFTLEAIVMPRERPVVFVRDSGYDDIEEPWTHLNDAAVRSRLTPQLRSIGRIEVPAAPWLPFGGTGFVVGQDLLMTNRHVAKLFAEGLGTRLTYHTGDAAIDFKRQVDTPPGDRTAYLTVREVVMIHPYWDMALLRVQGLNGHTPLRLSVRPPDDLVGTEVIAAGYPARDDRNDLALQDRIFAKQYNVKRVQPGKLRPRMKVRSFENVVNALTHDSSTLGGNSGSAIIDVQTGDVVGLHFAGEYLKSNYAVPTYELARDKFVVAAKLNFAGSLTPTNDWMPAWVHAGGAEGAEPSAPSAPDTTAAGATQSQTVQTQSPAAAGANSVTVTVPIRITVTVGEAQPATVAAQVASPTAEVEAPRAQIPVIFGNLENRKGYQSNFLALGGGEVVPMPALTGDGKSIVAKLEDGSHELKYHKFSVVIHKGRRMALFTASNVDWRDKSHQVNGKKPSRGQLTGIPEGTLEQWVTDPRIALQHQLPDVFYTKDGGAFDKGHLVRRDDVCWGASFKDIQKANGDTYHTTNCSPQVAKFNQAAKGIDNWGDLEDLVQKQTKAEKACVFAGPVLAEDDPLFEGKDDTGKILIRIPRSFWKVVVVKASSGPQAYGFVLEQDLSAVPTVEEFVVPDKWRVHMRSILDIEEMLQGLADLGWFKEFDQFETNEGAQIAGGLSKS